jgi:hypothetical protein
MLNGCGLISIKIGAHLQRSHTSSNLDCGLICLKHRDSFVKTSLRIGSQPLDRGIGWSRIVDDVDMSSVHQATTL